jgi:hypothetical protein
MSTFHTQRLRRLSGCFGDYGSTSKGLVLQCRARMSCMSAKLQVAASDTEDVGLVKRS